MFICYDILILLSSALVVVHEGPGFIFKRSSLLGAAIKCTVDFVIFNFSKNFGTVMREDLDKILVKYLITLQTFISFQVLMFSLM